jgi:hypothetical protein
MGKSVAEEFSPTDAGAAPGPVAGTVWTGPSDDGEIDPSPLPLPNEDGPKEDARVLGEGTAGKAADATVVALTAAWASPRVAEVVTL